VKFPTILKSFQTTQNVKSGAAKIHIKNGTLVIAPVEIKELLFGVRQGDSPGITEFQRHEFLGNSMDVASMAHIGLSVRAGPSRAQSSSRIEGIPDRFCYEEDGADPSKTVAETNNEIEDAEGDERWDEATTAVRGIPRSLLSFLRLSLL
jgi:hypothetical protein